MSLRGFLRIIRNDLAYLTRTKLDQSGKMHSMTQIPQSVIITDLFQLDHSCKNQP